MNLKITVQDLMHIFEEIQAQTGIPYQVNGYETCLQLPSRLGQSSIRNWHLRDGLDLYVQTHNLLEEMTITSCNHYAMFGLCYGISGTATLATQQPGAEIVINPNSCLSVNMMEAQIIGLLPANQAICIVEIAIAPHLLQSFLETELDDFQPDLRQCLNQPNHFSWHESTITPVMMTPLHQILKCPYQGVTQRLYLESKTLEVIALHLQQLKTLNRTIKKQILKSDEIEQIYQARDILIQQMYNPPSLLSLARQVGLNDYKLKQGFHQVFGTTAFGCLHQHRMEQARHLLETQRVQVAIAAQFVGYSSLSSFHRAYKKYFGVNPGQHRSENRS